MNDEDIRAQFAVMRDEDREAALPFQPPARTHSAGSWLWRAVATAASIVVILGALGVGMAWGTTAGYASGRLEGDRQRAEITATTQGATGALSTLRRELVRARAKLDARGESPDSILAVREELRAIEANIQRIERDLLPRASSTAPLPPSTNVPINRAMAVTCAALGRGNAPAISQETPDARPRVPVADLPRATIRTSAHLPASGNAVAALRR